jgi:hypothetical protein
MPVPKRRVRRQAGFDRLEEFGLRARCATDRVHRPTVRSKVGNDFLGRNALALMQPKVRYAEIPLISTEK